MVSATATLINPQGLHMRPAGNFAAAMGKFDKCNITVTAGETTINGKSPMALMAAGLHKGTEVTITCDGKDEQEALNMAINMIKSGLGDPMTD